jgi:hypothetical protein
MVMLLACTYCCSNFWQIIAGQIDGKNAIGICATATDCRDFPGSHQEPIYFSSYVGSFSVSSFFYASQFYDAFFFYHKAYFVNVFL